MGAKEEVALSLLGSPKVRCHGELIELPMNKQTLLFVYLVCHPDEWLQKEQLAYLLWSDKSEELAKQSCRKAIYHMKKQLPSVLSEKVASKRGKISFQAAEVIVDVDVLLEHNSHSLEDCFFLEKNLGKTFLGGLQKTLSFEFEEWYEAWKRKVTNSSLTLLERFGVHYAEHGKGKRAIQIYQQALEVEPFDEELHQKVMLAFSEQGLGSSAIHHFQKYKKKLKQELGVEPSQELSQVANLIQEQMKVAEKRPFAAKLEEKLSLSNYLQAYLPTISSLYQKREEEEAVLQAFRDGHRLITVVGVGGCGKTQLCCKVAKSLEKEFSDGVFFLSLSKEVSSELELFELMARQWRFLPGPAAPLKSQITSLLSDKTVLLIFDSFEFALSLSHVLSELIACTKELSILVSSREKTCEKSEKAIPLAGFSIHSDDGKISDAVSFFQTCIVEKTSLGKDFFASQKSAIASLCEKFVGLPFLLEKAALLLDRMDFSELFNELHAKEDIGSSLLETSWTCLFHEQQQVLLALAVWGSSLEQDMVYEYCQTKDFVLRSLLERGWIQKKERENLLQLHDLQRSFLLAKLEEKEEQRDVIWRRFSDYLYEKIVSCRPGITTFHEEHVSLLQKNWMQIEQLLLFFVEKEEFDKTQTALEMLFPVFRMFYSNKHRDIFLEQLLSLLEKKKGCENLRLEIRLLLYYNNVNIFQGKKESAFTEAEVATFSPRQRSMYLFTGLSGFQESYFSMDYLDAVEEFGRSAEPKSVWKVKYHSFLAYWLHQNNHRKKSSQEHFQKALDLSDELGDSYGGLQVLLNYARTSLRLGNSEKAEDCLNRARLFGLSSESYIRVRILTIQASLDQQKGRKKLAYQGFLEACGITSIQKKDKLTLASYFFLFEALVENGDYAMAKLVGLFYLQRFIKRIAVMHKKGKVAFPKVFSLLSWAFVNTGDDELFFFFSQYINEHLDVYPKEWQTLYFLSWSLYFKKRGDLETSSSLFSFVLKKQPLKSKSLLLKAKNLHRELMSLRGDISEAAACSYEDVKKSVEMAITKREDGEFLETLQGFISTHCGAQTISELIRILNQELFHSEETHSV